MEWRVVQAVALLARVAPGASVCPQTGVFDEIVMLSLVDVVVINVAALVWVDAKLDVVIDAIVAVALLAPDVAWVLFRSQSGFLGDTTRCHTCEVLVD